MKRVMILVVVAFLSCPGLIIASDYSQISGLSFSVAKGSVGSPVTITAYASGTNLYYKFWANTLDYCQSQTANWVVLRDWSLDNIFMWTPSAPGFYTVIVWVSPTPNVSCSNQIGAGFTVEDAGGGTLNVAGNWRISVHQVGCDNVEDYTETDIASQDGQNVSVYFPSTGLTVQGTLSGNTLTTTNLPVSFPADGGTTTMTAFSATFSNNGNTLSFTSAWTWNGSGQTCSGTSTGSGTKQN